MDYEPTLIDKIATHYAFLIDLFILILWIIGFCALYTAGFILLIAFIRVLIDTYHRSKRRLRRRYK